MLLKLVRCKFHNNDAVMRVHIHCGVVLIFSVFMIFLLWSVDSTCSLLCFTNRSDGVQWQRHMAQGPRTPVRGVQRA